MEFFVKGSQNVNVFTAKDHPIFPFLKTITYINENGFPQTVSYDADHVNHYFKTGVWIEINREAREKEHAIKNV